ncbi:CARDB domain-containing protein [Halobaculum sp. P14]|uniref:CARDB domain-containing protein n=1 Tax=Halobaculum sp. P14 TaxID=3421638 RepID=UPI003EB8261A
MQETHTDVPALFKEFRDALAREDLPAAVEAAVRIDDAEASVDSLLTDFVTAVDNGETQLARTILGQISETYERGGEEFEAKVQRAMAAVEQGTLTESEREQLLQFTRNAAQTNLSRTGFLVEAVSFFEGDVGESSLVETTKRVKQAEQNIDSASEAATSTASNADITASPGLLGSSAPDELTQGTSVTLTVTVGNVGDAESGPLSLAVSTEDGLEPGQSSYGVGPLAGGARRRLDVELTGRSAGTHSVTLSLQADRSTVESLNESFTVKETADTVREAIVGSDGGALDATDVRNAISYWADDSPVPGTGGKTVDTETIQRLVTEWVDANGGGDA